MKKIFCGAVIALIGVIYSIALMVMATINNVYSGDVAPGLWGLIRGYGSECTVCNTQAGVKFSFII